MINATDATPAVPPLAAANAAAAAATAAGPTWFGHPRQLARLFSTEAMERFGFYGLRTLLALYLVMHFQYAGAASGRLVGGYLALVFLTPFFGGLLADRVLGHKRSVKFGAIVMMFGYFALCFGGDPAKPYAMIDGVRHDITVAHQGKSVSQYVVERGAKLKIRGNDDGSVSLLAADGHEARHLAAENFKPDATRNGFYTTLALAALALVSVGNGFFKPNISTIVGQLYAKGDRRRDAGYGIFYMGINLGSTFSTLLCPILALGIGSWPGVGWGAGFGLAAVGMGIAWGLIQFSDRQLAGYGEPPPGVKPAHVWLTYAGTLAVVPLVFFLLQDVLLLPGGEGSAGLVGYLAALPLLGKLLGLCFVLGVPAVLAYAWTKGTRAEAEMMTAAVILIIFNTVFWSLFEQAASSLTLFAQQNTSMSVFGLFDVNAGVFQFFNPFFIVTLTPVFAALWRRLHAAGAEPPIAAKFALGLIGAGAGFLLLVLSAHFPDAAWKVSLWWLVGLYFIHTVAELCISPVGLSMVSKLAMPQIVALMFGLYFVSIAVAEFVAGALSALASVKTVGGEVTNPELSLATFAASFWHVGLFAIAAGVVLLVLAWPMKRLMHGVT